MEEPWRKPWHGAGCVQNLVTARACSDGISCGRRLPSNQRIEQHVAASPGVTPPKEPDAINTFHSSEIAPGDDRAAVAKPQFSHRAVRGFFGVRAYGFHFGSGGRSNEVDEGPESVGEFGKACDQKGGQKGG